MSLRKNIQYVFIANVITILLSALVYPVVLKIYHFNAVEFGIYQKYMSISALISSFIFFSLDTTYISENKKHTENEKNYFFTLLIIIFLIGIILCNIVFFLFKIKVNIIYILLLILSSNLFQIFIVLLKDERELRKSSFILVQQNIINLLIIFIIGYYFKSYKVFIFGMIISNLYGIFKLYPYIKIKLYWNGYWVKKFIKNNFEKIFYQTVANIFQRNSQEIPVLLFLKYFGENIVGCFNIGNKLLVLGNRVFSSALSQTFLVHMSKSREEKNLILNNYNNLAVLFFCGYVYISLLSDYYLKYIIGENFFYVAEIVRFLSPLLYLEALVSPYTNFFVVENKMKIFTFINIIFSVFRILLIYFLGKKLNFNNILLVFVLTGCMRYLFLNYFIFKGKNNSFKNMIFCLFFIINLFLIIKLYNILFFKFYIITVTFIFLFLFFYKIKNKR